MRGRVLLILALAGTALLGAVERPGALPFDHFEVDSTGHSWRNSYLLALASDYGYRGRVKKLGGASFAERFQEKYGPLGLEVVGFIDTDKVRADTQVIVLAREDLLLAVFCGSEAHGPQAWARDWLLTDSRINMAPYHGMGIHKGFAQGLDAAYDELKALITEHLSGYRRLWLTGHSLGGALASLAAYRLVTDGVAVQGVYTFASPKIGDAAWVERFEALLGKRAQHWVNLRDPIVRTPPTLDEKERYERVGPVNIILADKVIELDGEFSAEEVPINLAEHRMGAYVSYLYWSLPPQLQELFPEPPAVCGASQVLVGRHPETDLPLCKTKGMSKISAQKCLAKGGEVLDDWCAFEKEDYMRYRVRGVKIGSQ